MSIELTEDQKELKELVRSFMEREGKPYRAQYDESGEFPVEKMMRERKNKHVSGFAGIMRTFFSPFANSVCLCYDTNRITGQFG